ncbi:putative 26S proteasome non-ATPase regulatory subunit 9 [Diplonema papillatum]|nr:putative 26S proteasome non-ATPase regulatory subunit 9 [Diplonema papillatum]KAJ9440300.1 putative 26S proteasome non-ATPase regulatory subunit 9 [Diplonema papillatum]
MSSEADALPADLPSLKELLKALVKQRTELEQELKFNIDALKSTPAGLDEALIDRDGFPRADCDLFAVTRSRGRVACLRNDLKDLMKRAETIMHAIHKAAAMQPDDVASALPTSASLGDACESTQPAAHVDAAKDTVDPLVARYTAYDPFLTVSSVLPTSPAEEAGLLKDDFIVAWSGVTKQHPDAMAMISQITKRHENEELAVVIRRGGETRKLLITPKKWSGNGLLGCVLLRLKNQGTSS